MSEEIIIKQKINQDLEIDPCKSCVMIIQHEAISEVIQLDYESIPALITALQKLGEK